MQENYLLVLLGLETVIVLIFVIILIEKSRQISELLQKFSGLKYSDEDYIRLQKQKEDFVAMVVHELRSPLSVIRGSADLLINETTNLTKEDIVKFLTQIKSSSEWLLKLVNDILDVSKMESGIFELKKTKGNLVSVVDEVLSQYENVIKSRGIKLTKIYEEKLPEISFDPDRVKQVLNNLISNAIKFTLDDGEIITEIKRMDGSIKVSVCDNGETIPDEIKPRLFHKFAQLNTPNHSREKGTGLGLYICKGIVDSHGGSVWVEDFEPKGVRFSFTIPVTKKV